MMSLCQSSFLLDFFHYSPNHKTLTTKISRNLEENDKTHVLPLPLAHTPSSSQTYRLHLHINNMPSLLFVLSTPLPPPSNSTPRTSRRRPFPILCANTPPSSDPSWSDLARSLGSSEDTPPRPPPQWKQPIDSTPADSSAWSAWKNAANADAEEELIERDPRKETDFWRSTAKDLTKADSEGGKEEIRAEQVPREASQEMWRVAAREMLESGGNDVGDDIEEEVPESTRIWGMARRVTGEMKELESMLREDLEGFDVESRTEDYREIARELVGDGEEVDWKEGGVEGLGGPERGVNVASGWNPDVDWKRFDDFGRVEERKRERENREVVENEAVVKRKEAYERLEKEEETLTYTDENGRVLSEEEVRQAKEEGALFVDVAKEELKGGSVERDGDDKFDADKNAFESGRVPGFIANRYTMRGIYGTGFEGAEEYVKELEEKGIPLRDPKADAQSWREAARELNIEISVDVVEGEEVKSGDMGENIVDSVEEVVDPAEVSSSWSTWRQGTEKWERAVATAAPRDPKREVDMWRESAKELAIDVESVTEASGSENDFEGDKKSSENGNPWSAWRNANTRWESSIGDVDEKGVIRESGNPWTSNVEKDWGVGMDGKTSSDRSAWESWNKVKGGLMSEGGNQIWWSGGGRKEDKRGISNTEQWKDTAVEDVEEVKEDGKDETLDFWKDVVKDITTGGGDGVEDKDGGGGGGEEE